MIGARSQIGIVGNHQYRVAALSRQVGKQTENVLGILDVEIPGRFVGE